MRYWRWFGDLQTMRPAPMSGIAPIPWDKIVGYCEFYNLSKTDTTIMLRVIRNMDSALIAALTKRNAGQSS